MVEIVSYRKFQPQEGKVTYLKGFIKIRMQTEFGMMECRELLLFAKNGKAWVNFPYKYREDQEENKYYHYCSFGIDDKRKFDETLINAIRTYIIENGPNDSDQDDKSPPSSNKEVLSMDPTMKMKETQEEA